MTEPAHTIVVGGSRGIGAVIASRAADANHLVSVLSRGAPSDERLTANHIVTDLRVPTELEDAVRALDQRPPFANLIFAQRFRGDDADDWEGEVAVSLTATKVIIERLTERRSAGPASVVVVGSFASRLVAQEQTVGYHAAKAGLAQLVRYYATMLGPRGIRVNAVVPGAVLKPEAADFYRQNPTLVDRVARATPLGRWATPDDISAAVEYLCGTGAGFITGQLLAVDGGLALQFQGTLAAGGDEDPAGGQT